MIWHDGRFWAAYLGWHAATEHPWDMALALDAVSMSVTGFARDLGELLIPAIEAGAAFRKLGERLAAVL